MVLVALGDGHGLLPSRRGRPRFGGGCERGPSGELVCCSLMASGAEHPQVVDGVVPPLTINVVGLERDQIGGAALTLEPATVDLYEPDACSFGSLVLSAPPWVGGAALGAAPRPTALLEQVAASGADL